MCSTEISRLEQAWELVELEIHLISTQTLSAATTLLEGLPQFLFSHREVKCLPSSAHQVPFAMFTEETVFLLLLDALRDSLSMAQACRLSQEELHRSSRRSPSVCPLAGAVTHSMRPGSWLLPAQGAAVTTASTALQKHVGELHLTGTGQTSPYGHTRRLRPVNTSTYAYNNVSSKHTFPFLFKSSTHTALALLLRTRLQATTSIFCSTPSNHAPTLKPRGSCFGHCGSATNFRAQTWLKWLHKVLLPLSSRQTRQFPLFSCPRDQMTNLPGLTCHFYS